MTAIIPFFMPSPYPVYRDSYVGSRYDGPSSSEVSSQHREVMGALKKLGENKLAVSVPGFEILPHAQAAYDKLFPAASEYDVALRKWNERYLRIKAWQNARKERKEEARREARKAERQAERQAARYADADLYRSRFFMFRTPTVEEALALVDSKAIPTPNINAIPLDYGMYHREMDYLFDFRFEGMLRLGLKTHPKEPGGYRDLPAIKEVLEAASTVPNAVLTIPVDAVQKIRKWSV